MNHCAGRQWAIWLCIAAALSFEPSMAAAQQQGHEITLGFDGLPDLANHVDSFGVSFTGASVLQCGGALNCGPFPPFSGKNVVYDTPGAGGVITARFDPRATGNVRKVSARITGNRSVTMSAFDDGGALLDSVATGGPNYVGSSSGLPANMLLTVTARTGGKPIRSITFHDSGNTFTVDNFTYARSKTIMLDPGHGQIKVGNVFKYQRPASPTYQLYEDVLTLDMAKLALTPLQQNYAVSLTRTGAIAPFAPADCGVPCNIDLEKRRELAEKYETDVFVSLHTNASANKKVNGSEAFYKGSDHDSADLASRVVTALSGTGLSNRGSSAYSYRVLSPAMSNTLTEIAFHTNSELAAGQTITDEFRLSDATHKKAMADAIAKAIDEFIKAHP